MPEQREELLSAEGNPDKAATPGVAALGFLPRGMKTPKHL